MEAEGWQKVGCQRMSAAKWTHSKETTYWLYNIKSSAETEKKLPCVTRDVEERSLSAIVLGSVEKLSLPIISHETNHNIACNLQSRTAKNMST